MTAKEFFKQVRHAESELRTLNIKLRHYEDLGLSFGGISGVPGGHNRATSRVEMAAVGAVDVLQDLQEQKRAYLAIIARAESVIGQITQEKYQKILTYRYLCGWTFANISDELKYKDPNSIYRAHGWALSEAQKIINAQEKQSNENKDLS